MDARRALIVLQWTTIDTRAGTLSFARYTILAAKSAASSGGKQQGCALPK